MALLYQSELRPSKIELLDGWAPSQPWFAGDRDHGLSPVAAYRFDDPAGEVGVETLLVRAGEGPILQVPVTYRDAPLPGADAWLIGTLEHSVLGTRWVYDGVGDPVYLLTAATAAVTGGSQAEMMIEIDGEMVRREPTALVAGSVVAGSALPTLPAVTEISVRNEARTTVVNAGSLHIVVARVLDGSDLPTVSDATKGVLSGTWAGQTEPRLLAVASVG
jgi:Maltokinase N-terminal cap domain